MWLHEEPSGRSGSLDRASRELVEAREVPQSVCFLSDESLAGFFYSFVVYGRRESVRLKADLMCERERKRVIISGGAG